MPDVEYLEQERKKLWEAVESIRGNITELYSKTSEDVAIARQNSKDTSMFKNRAKISSEEAEKSKTEVLEKVKTLSQKIDELEKQITNFNAISADSNTKYAEIKTNYENIQTTNIDFKAQLEEIKVSFNSCKTFLTESESIKSKLQQQAETCADYELKIKTYNDNSLENRNKIKGVYNEIFGYDQKNDKTGTIEHISGLKDQLKLSYEKLENKFNELNTKFEDMKKEKFQEVDEIINNKNMKFDEAQKMIETLLPGAMSAGLSSAYCEKREKEVEERNRSDRIFFKSIIILTVISLLPFGLGCYLFFGKKFDIQTIIHDFPRIVMATIPLYAPTLWVAYSSNRKSNLAKRLIEEYNHKEALSKTFEGLSKQIANLDDDETSNSLKIKLLYNIVSMSSENPGALIKGYNKSDHPFMDIIDKSVNLTNALEKLSKFPGIGDIASSLLGKVEDNQGKKVQEGITTSQKIVANSKRD